MLLELGCGKQISQWVVNEKKAPGFSRVYYIEGGEAWYIDINGGYRLKQGYLYIFPSHAPFSITHDPQNQLECLWYHLNLFPTMVTSLIEIPVPEGSELWHILFAFRQALKKPDCSSNTLRVLADALVALLYDRKVFPLPDPAARSWESYFQEHAAENTPIETIANYFGYTPEHFIRMFHERVGMSPCQYRIHCRLSRAISMLKEDVSLSDIAQTVGYGEVKSFSRAFRVHYGLSPQQYKQRDHSLA